VRANPAAVITSTPGLVAKRSPILGYNHNVRHRGLIFHVQTEDSGVGNPHIFTHLFHGGVIISSRKLVYDNGSAEESIKSLMQAQHKAVLKDLKATTFDEKIDAYLGGTPGLEPSQAGARLRRDTLVTPPPPLIDQMDDQVTPAAGSSLTEAVLAGALPVEPAADPSPVPAAAPVQPMPPVVSAPAAAGQQRQRNREDDVSAAFRAIAPNDDAPGVSDAVPDKIDEDETTPVPRQHDIQRVYSSLAAAAGPASDGVPETRAHRKTPSGAYAQYNVHKTDRIAVVHDQPTAPLERKGSGSQSGIASGLPRAPGSASQSGIPRPPGAASQSGIPRPPGSASQSGIAPRPSQAGIPARPVRDSQGGGSRPPPIAPPLAPVASRPGSPSTPPPIARPAGRPHAPPAAPPRVGQAPQQPRTGVVVSRPAVIVGGPPKVIGGPSGQPAGRRAREEPARPNLFGKDLISEKSLDEVILAYLSEDAAEE
jgi:hypothetical protein